MYNCLKYKQIVFFEMAFHGRYAWFCHVYFNAVCRLDLDTDKIEIETFFPVKDDCYCQYGGVAYHNGKLILSPRNAAAILIYDLRTHQFTEIGLSSLYMPEKSTNLFANIVLEEDNLFFLPGRYRAVVKMNLLTLELTFYSDWYKDLKHFIKREKQVIFGSYFRFDNVILLPFWQGNKVVKFHMKSFQHEIMEIGSKECQYSSVLFDGKSYWLGDRGEKSICRWDPEKESLSAYKEYPADFESKGGVRFLKKVDDKILVFPLYGNMIVALDVKSGETKEFLRLDIKPKKELKDFIFADNNFLGFSEFNHKIYTYCMMDGYIYCIDLDTGSVTKIKSQVVAKETIPIKKEIASFMNMQGKDIIMEKMSWSLEVFIEKIKRDTQETRFDHNSDIGEKILNAVR